MIMKMKKNILVLFAIVSSVLVMSSCNNMLNVDPEGEVSGNKLYETVEGASAALNGAYRILREPSYVPDNREQFFGLASDQLTMDLMGEDMIIREPGYGFYGLAYGLSARQHYMANNQLPYDVWARWYALVNQANDIIARTPMARGDQATKNSIIAQAYSLRGFAYFTLIRWYQKTYKGHEASPGVPIYTTPTNISTQGNGRSTVDSVYMRIVADLDSADVYFAQGGPNLHKSHIDRYVNYGLQSRVAMVMEKWDLVVEKASLALAKPGVKLMDPALLLTGFNDLDNEEWMWGVEVSDAQVTGYCGLWVHMDARIPLHAFTSRKIVNNWLYEQYDRSDIRRRWFLDPDSVEIEEPTGPRVKYSQMKYQAPNVSSLAGDYLYMRAAEMYLNRAEAYCRLGQYDNARRDMITLIAPRLEFSSEYEGYINRINDGNTISGYAMGIPIQTNLLDYILLERRKELWGEGFRWHDIIRNKTGLHRARMETNHTYPLDVKDPESWTFVLLIPQAEFDGNVNMDIINDQNPSPEGN